MTIRLTPRSSRAALAAAALALAGCSADPPLSPAAPEGPRMSRQAGADAAGGGRASIYVIGSGRGHRPGE